MVQVSGPSAAINKPILYMTHLCVDARSSACAFDACFTRDLLLAHNQGQGCHASILHRPKHASHCNRPPSAV